MPLGLLALALGGFGIGLTEFVIMGLLPEVAADFGVDEAAAGWLVTGYALAVAIGAVVITALALRLPRKATLLGLLVLFIAGNLLSALAPTFDVMLLARVVAALNHGAFFGIGSVLAASLVAPERKAAAVAIMFTGLTAANVLGVPFGTFLGQALGWRATFWAITAIGVLALIGIATTVREPRGEREVPSLRRELGAFRRPQVWLTLAITVLGYGGVFGAFTYLAYTLTGVSGFDAAAVPWLLVVLGLGLFAGNILGGRAADRARDRTLLVVLGALVVVLVGFALTASSAPATVVWLALLGGFGFATVPGLQTRIMAVAEGAPTLASGANIAAFNVGNALGAFLGGLGIAAGLGYTSPIWIGAGLTLLGLGVMAAAARGIRRDEAGAGRARRELVDA
ncbi:MFS transporter [Agrococcus sp. SL85]|uniref:MFS transporter n=1 Tax=Agrococcus sp. SL85 TaxID=2995141 RepID=UPI00226C71B5|nr:MFS transporter [Agrococcus sp. SL85]WAC67176.1 MFS transporter [Agrococcus sp. SL85]